ncbi:MAG: hypothetical protein HOP06_04825 [Methylotenera sp.]|nr:hypothetical protein [Methylotenera sp.]
MTIRIALFWTVCIFLGPVLLSLSYLLLIDGSIGPVVLGYSVLGVVALGVVWGSTFSKKHGFALAIPAGVVIGVVLGILLINYFMILTFLLGIKDYDAM